MSRAPWGMGRDGGEAGGGGARRGGGRDSGCCERAARLNPSAMSPLHNTHSRVPQAESVWLYNVPWSISRMLSYVDKVRCCCWGVVFV